MPDQPGPAHSDPRRQAAYDAVYAAIRRYPPQSADSYGAACENARIWRAVEAALDAFQAAAAVEVEG